MKYEAYYLDCCTPSYFRGSDELVIQAAVNSKTTYGELLPALINDIQEFTDYNGIEYLDYEAAENAVIEMFKLVKHDEVVFEARYADPVEDDGGYPCYYYVGIRKAPE